MFVNQGGRKPLTAISYLSTPRVMHPRGVSLISSTCEQYQHSDTIPESHRITRTMGALTKRARGRRSAPQLKELPVTIACSPAVHKAFNSCSRVFVVCRGRKETVCHHYSKRTKAYIWVTNHNLDSPN